MAIQHFPRFHRLLHWITALAMTVMFITGLLRMTWMNKNHIVKIIEDKAAGIPAGKAAEIATAVREPMWEWHEAFAYVVFALLLARIVYMLASGIKFPNPLRRHMPIKERFQGLSYAYFYVFVAVSTFTGASLQQKWFAEYEDPIEAVHKWGLYWFPVFIVLHAGGIILAEYSSRKGITSKMISGD